MISLLKIPYLRLKYRFLPDEAQRFWAQELLNSQGLTAKIGQVLAQGKKAELPKSTMSRLEAKKLFEKTFQVPVTVLNEGIAASMGQVFFIEAGGKSYAVKCLHPGIREKLRKEIDNILLLGKYFAKTKGFNFDKTVFRRFLTEVFEEETDLVREAHFQKQFGNLFQGSDIKIPQVIEEFSNENILCQELVTANLAMDTITFKDFKVFTFFFRSLIEHQLLHGDLNDRNWGLKENTVIIYDFGCSQTVSPRRTGGLLKLLRNEHPADGFRELGVRLEATWFKGKEQELRDALFSPLLGTISPSWSYSEDLQGRFGDHIKALREYTDPWVLLMMRSLFSLIRIYQQKQIPIPMGEILAPFITIADQDMKATQIRIEVLEKDEQVIFMTLPISALENLEALMPEKVADKIQEEKISVPDIIREVKATQFKPQVLFELVISLRSYKVWID